MYGFSEFFLIAETFLFEIPSKTHQKSDLPVEP